LTGTKNGLVRSLDWSEECTGSKYRPVQRLDWYGDDTETGSEPRGVIRRLDCYEDWTCMITKLVNAKFLSKRVRK
jgi:hypothetical protein